jgi:hypothetical protein
MSRPGIGTEKPKNLSEMYIGRKEEIDMPNTDRPKDDLEGDTTPLIRGRLGEDPKMPIELRMSTGLAGYLLRRLREVSDKDPGVDLYISVLEQLLAPDAA